MSRCFLRRIGNPRSGRSRVIADNKPEATVGATMRVKACILACYVALITLSGGSLAYAYEVATVAVPTALQADKAYPQLSREITSTRIFAPELAEYVDNPETVCTIFAPDNKAINNTMEALGEYVGLFLQNRTMQEHLLNYHVIPGRAIKAEALGTTVNMSNTMANETVVFVQRKGRPYASFNRKYVVPLEIVNIPAGKCVIHIISASVMAPPSILPKVEGWLKLAGNQSSLQSPRELWLSASAPVPGPGTAQPEVQNGAPEAVSSGEATPTAAAAPAATSPAKSSSAAYLVSPGLRILALIVVFLMML